MARLDPGERRSRAVGDTRHLSAGELAAAGLPGLPRTVSAIIRMAKREGWTHRSRSGRGGGREFALAALPEEARQSLEVRERQQAAVSAVAVVAEVDQRQLQAAAASRLSARQRAVMEARAAILLEIERRAVLGGASPTAALEQVVADSRAGTLPPELAEAARRANDRDDGSGRLSRRSLFRWRTMKNEGTVTALAPVPSRTPEPLPPWFRDFLTFYATPQKRTVTHAIELWRRSDPTAAIPSEGRVRTALAKLTLLERSRGRLGPQALKALQAYRSRDTSDLLPTSVYVADGKTFDAEVAHPIHGQAFRPEITTIMDARTRRITGWSAALDESAHAVLDALRMACTTAGIPALFYTDRGPGYRNNAMDAPLTGFLARLDITPMRALPYNSQAKGLIERLNHLWSTLARELPTYISRDMDREAKSAVHKRSRRELKAFGASAVLPRFDAFLAAAEDAVARYNARPHSALPKIADPRTGRWRHQSPDEAWADTLADGFEPILPSTEEIDDLFRPWVVRTASRCIVKWLDNAYFAIELERFHGRKVIVGYDIHDASRVWVREIEINEEGERVPGRLIAVAVFGGNRTRYVPVTAERAAIEKRARGRVSRLRKKIDIAQQEVRPSALLELSAERRAIASPPAESATRADTSPPPADDPDGRPIFHTDTALVVWMIENPDKVLDRDREFVRRYVLNTSSGEAVLRMSGVDLAALRAVMKPQPPPPPDIRLPAEERASP
jgi:putative transposase